MARPFNICIVRPPGYLWSSVFLELAELLAFSLEDLGHPARIVENRLDPGCRNILIGGHLFDIAQTREIPPDTIIFNTEQVGAYLTEWNERAQHLVRHFPAWDYSRDNIARFSALGLPSPMHFTFGYHPGLRRIPADAVKDIDVLFYGFPNEPRLRILRELERRGVRVTSLFGVFGAARDASIAKSKLVLNLHQHPTKVFEIVRVHYLMNNGKAILAQCDPDTKIDADYKPGLILAGYDQIVDRCIELLDSPEALLAAERQSLETIMRFDAVAILRELVSAVG